MTLAVGSITVSPVDASVVTTPGMATNIWTTRTAMMTFPDPNTPPGDWPGTPTEWHDQCLPMLVQMKQGLADECTATATGVIQSLTGGGPQDATVTVTITTSDGALQQSGGVDTTPPMAPRTIHGTIG